MPIKTRSRTAADRHRKRNCRQVRAEGAKPFRADPTSGAFVVRPEADVITCKTLRREARRVAFGLRLRQPLFEIRYLFLKARWQRQDSGRVTGARSSGHYDRS
jgi:hypothetical protein